MNNKIVYTCLAVCLFASMFCGCQDDTQIPKEFIPEQYLYLETDRELNIGTESSFHVIVNASSTWSLTTDASWCHFDSPVYNGRDTAVVTVDANRGSEERSCRIRVVSYFKNPITDSLRVVQPINTLPALEVTPLGDREVFYKGTSFTLNILYNYGVDFHVNYISGGENWIQTDPTSIADSEILTDVMMNVIVEPNMGTEDREAELTFTNTEDPNNTYSIRITQGHPVPAITGFADDFQISTTTGQPYTGEGWTFQSNPEGTLLFKQFNNVAQGMLINGSTSSQAEGYAIWPVFNIKAMQNKTLSYTWGAGNRNPALEGDVFELVGSTDYEGDALSATWTVIQDLTNHAESPAISLPNTRVEINLGDTPFADEERVYLAFRYVGGGHAYRIDNLKIGDVEN